MSKIYVGQYSLQIRLTTGVDITSASALLVKYKKPDGTEGSWTATEYDATTGVIYYDFTKASELDQAGTWTFWAHVTFSDDRVAMGEPVTEKIYSEGK